MDQEAARKFVRLHRWPLAGGGTARSDIQFIQLSSQSRTRRAARDGAFSPLISPIAGGCLAQTSRPPSNRSKSEPKIRRSSRNSAVKRGRSASWPAAMAPSNARLTNALRNLVRSSATRHSARTPNMPIGSPSSRGDTDPTCNAYHSTFPRREDFSTWSRALFRQDRFLALFPLLLGRGGHMIIEQSSNHHRTVNVGNRCGATGRR